MAREYSGLEEEEEEEMEEEAEVSMEDLLIPQGLSSVEVLFGVCTLFRDSLVELSKSIS